MAAFFGSLEDLHRTIRGVRTAERLIASDVEVPAVGVQAVGPTAVHVRVTGPKIVSVTPPYPAEYGGQSAADFYPGMILFHNAEFADPADEWNDLGADGYCLVRGENLEDLQNNGIYEGIVQGTRNTVPVVMVTVPPRPVVPANTGRCLVWYSEYLHLSSVAVTAGEVIEANKLIGLIDGNHEGGAHLHFGIGDGDPLLHPDTSVIARIAGQTIDITTWTALTVTGTHVGVPPYRDSFFTAEEKQYIRDRFIFPLEITLPWIQDIGSVFHTDYDYYAVDYATDPDPADAAGANVYSCCNTDVDVVTTVEFAGYVSDDVKYSVILRHRQKECPCEGGGGVLGQATSIPGEFTIWSDTTGNWITSASGVFYDDRTLFNEYRGVRLAVKIPGDTVGIYSAASGLALEDPHVFLFAENITETQSGLFGTIVSDHHYTIGSAGRSNDKAQVTSYWQNGFLVRITESFQFNNNTQTSKIYTDASGAIIVRTWDSDFQNRMAHYASNGDAGITGSCTVKVGGVDKTLTFVEGIITGLA